MPQTPIFSRPCNADSTHPPSHHCHPSYQRHWQGCVNIPPDAFFNLSNPFDLHSHRDFEQGEGAVAMGMAEMSEGEFCSHKIFVIAQNICSFAHKIFAIAQVS